MAFSENWRPSSPADADLISSGAQEIRKAKTAIGERFAIDHYGGTTTLLMDAADTGFHKQVTLIEAADIGTGTTGYAILGGQTVNGAPELVYTDETNTDVQITSGGQLLLVQDEVASAPSTGLNQGAIYVKNSGTQTELYFREESDGDEVQLTANGAVNVTLTPAASGAEVKTGTETAKYVSPSTLVSHEGVVKAWANIDGTGTPSYSDSYNFTGSITDNGNGDYSLTIDTDFATASYAAAGMAKGAAAGTDPLFVNIEGIKAVGSINIEVANHDAIRTDSADISVILIGDR